MKKAAIKLPEGDFVSPPGIALCGSSITRGFACGLKESFMHRKPLLPSRTRHHPGGLAVHDPLRHFVSAPARCGYSAVFGAGQGEIPGALTEKARASDQSAGFAFLGCGLCDLPLELFHQLLEHELIGAAAQLPEHIVGNRAVRKDGVPVALVHIKPWTISGYSARNSTKKIGSCRADKSLPGIPGVLANAFLYGDRCKRISKLRENSAPKT